jgi:two-component sensor histidine kinase
MKFKDTWMWHGVWVSSLVLGLGLYLLYSWLPVDGATGDTASFTHQGFRVRWIIEKRVDGLQENDLVLSANGISVEEWLNSTPKVTPWLAGQIVEYELIRDGETISLPVQVRPIAMRSVLSHWLIQLISSFAFLFLGVIVFWYKPDLIASRAFMLFCVSLAMQYWGNAFNLQFSALPLRWPFWIHFFYEFFIYNLSVFAVCYFALVFPTEHPFYQRHPRAVLTTIFVLPLILIAISMIIAQDWISAISSANSVSWIVAIIQIIFVIGVGIRSAFVARDPVSRAQIRWILWSASIGVAIIVPTYIIPLITGKSPLISHPAMMAIITYMAIIFGIAILRFHLFEIEIIINRTLVYATISILLISLYLLVIRLSTVFIQFILQRKDDTLTVFIATITVTLAFSPLRERIQHLIDRAFYRTKLDYQALLSDFSQRLAIGILPDQIHNLLTKTLPSKLQIEQASLFVLNSSGRVFSSLIDTELISISTDHVFAKHIQSTSMPFGRLGTSPTLPLNVLDFMLANNIQICVPLIVRDELIGFFNLGPKLSGDAFNRDEMKMFNALGRHAAVAVENSRLLQTKDHQAEVLSGLHQTAVAVSASLEIDQLLQTLSERVGQLLDVSSVYLCDYDENSEESIVRAEWINPAAKDQTSDIGTVHKVSDYPQIQKALKIRQPLASNFVEDISKTEVEADVVKKYGIRSNLIIPLIIHNRVTGFMELWETRCNREFSEEDIRLCQTVAADGATAIQRARLFETERKQRRLAEAIQEAAAVVNSSLELDVVFDYIFAQLEKIIQGDTFNIMLIEAGVAKIIRAHGYNDDERVKTVQEYQIKIIDFPTLHKMSTTGKALVIPDTSNSHLWTYKEDWQKPQSFIGAPICLGGETVGFLNVNGNRPQQFTADDALWLETFANTAAAAIDRAHLFEAERDQRVLAEALQEAASILSSSLELDQVLDHILDRIKTVISGDTYNIMLVNAGIARVVRWRGYEDFASANLISSHSIVITEYETFSQMIADNKATFIADTRQNSQWVPWKDWEWLRSYVGAPISIGGEIAGFINVDGKHPNMFNANDARYLEIFAFHAATALQNARLYQQIKDSLDEKEVLLKEIHHRVKNNMQVIISMLNLQTSAISDETISKSLRDSQSRIRSMALVHDKLYRSENLAQINFADYIRDLSSYLYSIYWNQTQDVDIDIQAQDIFMEIDMAVSCGLILNELISNAFKHAFPKDHPDRDDDPLNKIRVHLSLSDDGRLDMLVADNGIPPVDLDIRNVKTLGFQLIHALVQQLNGELGMEISNWTSFRVDIPYRGEGIE